MALDQIEIQCLSCGKRGKVPMQFASKSVRCKSCGHTFVVQTLVQESHDPAIDDTSLYSLASSEPESHVSPALPPWHLAPSAPSAPQPRERPSGRENDETSVWKHRVMDHFPKGVTVILLDMPSAHVSNHFINLLKFFWDENGDAQGFRYPSGEILLGLAGNMTQKCIYEILFNAIEGGYKYTNIANGNNVPAMKAAMQLLRLKGYSVNP